MTTPKRSILSDATVKTIVDAVVHQLGAAYLPSTGRPLSEVLERLDKIDVRLAKIEEHDKEHSPVFRFLHSVLAVCRGVGRAAAWLVKAFLWIAGLAATSAAAWTAIKSFFQAKTG